jgi:glucosamine--fructose-6-phosphate aminotransferase (isomerizing)
MEASVSLLAEIGEQPAVAERLLSAGRRAVEALADEARDRQVAYVLVAARGSSDHAAVYAGYALGVLARLPVALAQPSVISRYGSHPRIANALAIGISQSGRSPDVVSVLAEATRQGAVTAAITNDPASPLAGVARHVIDLGAGPELAVAATKTYTAQLLAVAMLAAALSESSATAWAALSRLPDAMAGALALDTEAAALAQDRATMEECVVLGRGYHLATALEWALKVKELAYVRAQGYSTADFQHGPVASLPRSGDILAVNGGGPLTEELLDLVAVLGREREARVLLVAPEEEAAPLPGVAQLAVPGRLPEWLTPITAILPAQLFTYHLARARGCDTESPRGLQKVTLTR